MSSHPQPLFGVSSVSSIRQETDTLLHDHRAITATNSHWLDTFSREVERQRYLQGGRDSLYIGGYPLSQVHGEIGENSPLPAGSLSGWPLSTPSFAAMISLQRANFHASFANSSWTEQISGRGPSSFFQPTLHTSLPLSYPTPVVTSNQPRYTEVELINSTLAFDIAPTEATEFPPKVLPVIIALQEDRAKLSVHQVFLRHQIEVFEASEEDVSTHTRGRNKRIKLGQVGIRCRHCAHLPVAIKQKGSVYFPATLLGLYQAAQNMSATHLQCGLCTQTPVAVKRQFATLMSTKAFGSGAGRPYWAQAAKKIGLIDSEEGIRFIPIALPSVSEEERDDSKIPSS